MQGFKKEAKEEQKEKTTPNTVRKPLFKGKVDTNGLPK